MTHLLGADHVARFTVLDSEGVLIEEETFTSDASFDPESVAIPDWTVAELESGLYEVRWRLSAAGGYYLRLWGDATGQLFEFSLLTDNPVIGETVTHYLTILDDDDALTDDAVLTTDAASDPNGETFAVDLASLGDGLYRVTWVSATTGVYTIRILADLSAIGDDPQRFAFETTVDEPETVVSPLATPVGSTLDDLVRGVAAMCRDFYRVRATSDGAAPNVWPDRQRLAGRPAKMFKGASLVVDSAFNVDNLGQEVHVLDSANGALVLDPDLPGPPRQGDTAYLINLESTGFTWDQYVEEINAQIRSIFPECVQPAVWTFTDLFDGNAPYLTPPEEFTHIYSIEYPSGGWLDTPVAIPGSHEVGEGDGWWWDEPSDRIIVGGNYRYVSSGQYLTIRGFGRWPELVDPGDITGIAYEWLRYAAAGVLTWSLRDQRRQAEAANNVNRADALRIKVGTRFPPNTVRIR